MQQQIKVMSNNFHYAFHHRFSALSINQKCGIHKQSVYEKLNLSPKPKKPMTPYFQFLAQIRPVLTKEFPGVKNTELVRIAAQRWNSVDSTIKEKLTNQFQEANTQYKKLKEEYEKQLTPDQKAAIERAEQYEIDLKEERRTKKKSLELGKPKRPVSTFFKYLHSRSNEKHKYAGVKDWVKAVAEEWKNLGPEVKAKYEEERKREYENWLKQLKQWEEKMIKEGNVDVVRTSSLVTKPTEKLKK